MKQSTTKAIALAIAIAVPMLLATSSNKALAWGGDEDSYYGVGQQAWGGGGGCGVVGSCGGGCCGPVAYPVPVPVPTPVAVPVPVPVPVPVSSCCGCGCSGSGFVPYHGSWWTGNHVYAQPYGQTAWSGQSVTQVNNVSDSPGAYVSNYA